MKKSNITSPLLTCMLMALIGGTLATATAGTVTGRGLPPFEPPDADYEERMEWWLQGRYGMFISWGPYAMFEGSYKGQKINEGCFAMKELRMPFPQYKEIVRGFSPDEFDADAVIRLVKDVGMKYIVVLGKHADGFAMWNSESSTFDLEDGTEFKRDILAELRDACRKHGIGFGIYYCLGWDWADPNATTGPFNDWTWDPSKADPNKYFENKIRPQVTELASKYAPDLFWGDVPGGTRAWGKELIAIVRKYRPNCIINDRLPGLGAYSLSQYPGDYDTPECYVPGHPMPRHFEVCNTMGGPWGWAGSTDRLRPPLQILKQLIETVSNDGNYLLNVSPTGSGALPGPQVSRLKFIGKWLQVNEESIRGARGSSFSHFDWGMSTTRDDDFYFQVVDWPRHGKVIVPGLKNRIVSVEALTKNGKRELPHASLPSGDLEVDVGDQPWFDPIPVFKVRIEGAPELDSRPLLQPHLASTLQLRDCEPGGDIEVNIGHGMWRWKTLKWNATDETVAWPALRVIEDGEFEVVLHYGADTEWQGNKLKVIVGEQALEHTVAYKHWDTTAPDGNRYIKQHHLGTVTLTPGVYALTIAPVSFAEGAENLINLREVELIPLGLADKGNTPPLEGEAETESDVGGICETCKGTGLLNRDGNSASCGDCAGTGNAQPVPGLTSAQKP